MPVVPWPPCVWQYLCASMAQADVLERRFFMFCCYLPGCARLCNECIPKAVGSNGRAGTNQVHWRIEQEPLAQQVLTSETVGAQSEGRARREDVGKNTATSKPCKTNSLKSEAFKAFLEVKKLHDVAKDDRHCVHLLLTVGACMAHQTCPDWIPCSETVDVNRYSSAAKLRTHIG